MDTQPDDGTGFRQLTNKDLVTYAIGRDKLTQLELELTLRLEEVVNQRETWCENLKTMPCGKCPVLRHAAPYVDQVIEDIEGTTLWL
jgi:hypothetical protein